MRHKESITAVCFAIAFICAIIMFPITSQLISSGDFGSETYQKKWLIDCVLGVVGLVSVLTGKRLSSRD